MGHVAVLDLLLARGANINSKDHTGRSPIIYAMINNHKKVIELLLKSDKLEVDPKIVSKESPF